MYLSVCKTSFKVMAIITIDKIITKGLTYEVLYVTLNEQDEYYELVADDEQYYSINSKCFIKL